MLSIVASGSGVPVASTAATPASSSSHSNDTPAGLEHLDRLGGDLGTDAVAADEGGLVRGHHWVISAGTIVAIAARTAASGERPLPVA